MKTALQNRIKGYFYAMSINKRSFTRVICEISLAEGSKLWDLQSLCFLKGGGGPWDSDIDQTSTEDDEKVIFFQSPSNLYFNLGGTAII